MSDEALTERAALAEPTEARFSMRSLFIAMAVVALLAALVGPLVRNLEPEHQVRLIGLWGIWFIAIVIVVAYQARQRFASEKLAGSTLLRLRMFDEKSGSASTARRWINVVGAGLVLLVCMMMISGMVVDPSSRVQGGVWPFWYGFVRGGFWGLLSGWWAARLVTSLWWRDSIRFCAHGILWDRRFAGWDHLVQHRWDETKGLVLELKGIDQRSVDLALKVPVPLNQREAVQAVLDQNAAGLHATTMPSVLELGRVPISVAVKHPQFGRYLGGALLRIVLVVAAFIYIIQIPAMREFDRSMYPAIFLTAAVNLSRWKWLGRSAGVPMVRLVGRRGWLALAVPLCATGICYFAGTNYSGTSPWPAYLAGVGFWYAALSAVGGLTARQLDLRANGLVLQGLCYWPWDKVRVLRWDPDGKGRLVFARGWQRVVSIVPSEQRVVVNILLTEKLKLTT